MARRRPGAQEERRTGRAIALWLRALTLLALAAPGGQAQVARISHGGAAFAQAPEPLRRLEGGWVAADAQGLRAFTAAGKGLALPDLPQAGPGQRCTAVAVLPPGDGPCAPGAPHLVAAMAGGTGEARILAVGGDGARWEWPTDGAGRPEGRNVVRDLALDRDGAIYAVFEDDRDILRIDLAGNRILHARVPEAAPGAPASQAPSLPPGFLAMVRDPATGDLYVGDRFGVHRVDPGGTAQLLLPADAPEHRPRDAAPGPVPPLTAAHLALHGRLLFIGDPHRNERFALHLDSHHLGAIPQAPGPLAISPRGQAFLAAAHGFRLLSLAELGAPSTGPRRASPSPAPPGSLDIPPPARRAEPGPRGRSARQLNRERARTLQVQLRSFKRAQRERPAWPAGRAEPASAPPAAPHPRRSPGFRTWALLGLAGAALADPSLPGALGQGMAVMPDPAAASFFSSSFGSKAAFLSLPAVAGQLAEATTEALAAYDQLGPACASPIVALLGLPACDPGYRSGILAQAQTLQGQAAPLLAPRSLSPGACRPGEPAAQAEARLALDRSDQGARYALFTAQATALCTQLERDGFVVVGVGFGLTGGGTLATPFRNNASLPLVIPALVLEETGTALTLAGFAASGVGARFCAMGSEATAAQADYEAWAESREADLVAACAGTSGNATLAGPETPPRPAALAVPSPLPVLADVLAKADLGCARTAGSGLTPPACAPGSRQGLVQRNATLAALYGQISASPGPAGPRVAAARLRQFAALANAAAFDIFSFGDGLFGAAEILTLEELPVEETGVAAATAAATAGADLLFGAANLVWASGYELQRIGALAGGQAAILVLTGNAGRRAELDQRPAPATAPGPAPVVPEEASGWATGAGAGTASAPAGPALPGTAPAEPGTPAPATSAASRTRPALLLWLRPSR